MSYLSDLLKKKITPAEFVAKSAEWLKRDNIPQAWKVWALEALERVLAARLGDFIADLIVDELREAIGLSRDAPPTG